MPPSWLYRLKRRNGVFCANAQLRNSDRVVRQKTSIPRRFLVLRHVANARLMGVKARQQRCPRRAAAPRIIELGKAQPPRRQRIQVRRRNLRTIAPQVRKPHVVSQNHHDIRLLRSSAQ